MAQKNTNLHDAKNAKNDEFYTRYSDIEEEISYYLEYDENVFRDKTILLPCDDPEYSEFTKYFAANFEAVGIKKLISTSYAHGICNQNITDFERRSKCFDESKHATHGKVFILERDVNNSKRVNVDDLQWQYLEGDGDFRSDEVKALRDEADFIITNEPFSLFRQFISWIFEAPTEKKFIIIGSQNAITYKEFFPLLKDNKVWLGCNMVKSFKTPDGSMKKFGNICWFTNVDHSKRHKEYQYMSMADNLRYNKKLIKSLQDKFNTKTYPKYDNYDAIEVPFCDAIPGDYCESWGVNEKSYYKLNSADWEITRRSVEDDGSVTLWIIPANGTKLREMMSKQDTGYREIIRLFLNSGMTVCLV
ncbi:MAG: adenine-specific methyltransferase EcoRI family protein [Acutalibacteraceae bacterium]|nr:adenine-specific methyltransferase EcoRI family protein [Acutalibacteraceae bacterium]